MSIHFQSACVYIHVPPKNNFFQFQINMWAIKRKKKQTENTSRDATKTVNLCEVDKLLKDKCISKDT